MLYFESMSRVIGEIAETSFRIHESLRRTDEMLRRTNAAIAATDALAARLDRVEARVRTSLAMLREENEAYRDVSGAAIFFMVLRGMTEEQQNALPPDLPRPRPAGADCYGDCSVCHEELRRPGSTPEALPACGHCFCAACLRRWELNFTPLNAPTCPLCRTPYGRPLPARSSPPAQITMTSPANDGADTADAASA